MAIITKTNNEADIAIVSTSKGCIQLLANTCGDLNYGLICHN